MGRCRLVVLDKTIEVACAPSRAFALLAEPRRAPSWQPWTPAAASLGPGRFAMVHDVLGVRLRWTGLADLDPCSRLAFAQDEGEFEAMEGAWDVADLGDGASRVHVRMRVELPFVLPVLLTEGAIRRALSQNLDEALYNLKTLLEASPPGRLARAGAGLPRGMPSAEA